MSLKSLSTWLKADRERGAKVMWQNQSYVFFRELAGTEAEGAMGVLHIPLQPGRSLAVDTAFHNIGMPVYVTSPSLTHASKSANSHTHGFARLMVAHDVGSAIKGAERGDIFFGSGDKAGRIAGVTKHPGKFFVLLPVASDAQQLVAGKRP
jgi:membrane-bound lytic murein transglycosylase A